MSLVTEKPLEETKQKVQLVEGKFTCSEASYIIEELINKKINFHKLQRLTLCEGNENSDTKYSTQRIAELENEKLIAKKYLNKARNEGYDVSIEGVLQIKFSER